MGLNYIFQIRSNCYSETVHSTNNVFDCQKNMFRIMLFTLMLFANKNNNNNNNNNNNLAIDRTGSSSNSNKAND